MLSIAAGIRLIRARSSIRVLPKVPEPGVFCGVPIAVTAVAFPRIFSPAWSERDQFRGCRTGGLIPRSECRHQRQQLSCRSQEESATEQFRRPRRPQFSEKDNFFARFSYEDQPIFTPGPFTNFLDGGGFTAGNQDNAYRSAAISELHTFSPKLLNEFRLGYNRINSHRVEPNANTDVSGQLGLLGVPFQPGFGGLPSICFVNYSCIGASDFLPSIEKQNSYVLNENLIWIRGRHSLKFGTEIRKEQFTIFQDSAPRGDMGFGPDFTAIRRCR